MRALAFPDRTLPVVAACDLETQQRLRGFVRAPRAQEERTEKAGLHLHGCGDHGPSSQVGQPGTPMMYRSFALVPTQARPAGKVDISSSRTGNHATGAPVAASSMTVSSPRPRARNGKRDGPAAM